MELKEFIKVAISDITEAIKDLQDSLENGAIINPTLSKSELDETILVNEEVRMIERLNFDVAVTASETTGVESSAKAGIKILGANIGAGNSSKVENVSRLTFSIPLVFPSTYVKTPSELRHEKRLKRPTY